MDPTVPPLCDAVSFTVCGDNVYTYGGASPEYVWRLHFVTGTWHSIPCTGAIPPPRQHHAAVAFAEHLVICGGEPLLRAPPPKLLPYYELSLDSFVWMRVDTFGAVPLNRSHHTCTVIGESMILLGGKPVAADAHRPAAPTNAQLVACEAAGFYDVFLLDIISRVWRAVLPAGPSPRLWGHSAIAFDDAYVILFGGLDVTARAACAFSRFGSPHHATDPPIAAVSSRVFVLDTRDMAWRAFSPAAAPPRALHAAHRCAHTMFVAGGLHVDAAGRARARRDLWAYDIPTGRWRAAEGVSHATRAVRGLSCVYESQLVWVPSMRDMWYLDVHPRSATREWKRISTRLVPLEVHPASPHEAEECSALLNPRRRTDAPPGPSQRRAEEDEGTTRPKTPSPMMVMDPLPRGDMESIRAELHELRCLIMAQQHPPTGSTPPKGEKGEEGSPEEPERVPNQSPDVSPSLPAARPSVSDSEREKKTREDVEKRRERERQRRREIRWRREQMKILSERLERLQTMKDTLEMETKKHLPVNQPTYQVDSNNNYDREEEQGVDGNQNKEEERRQESAKEEQGTPRQNERNGGAPFISIDTPSKEKALEERTPSPDTPDNSERWKMLLHILKDSTSPPSDRAFRASVSIM